MQGLKFREMPTVTLGLIAASLLLALISQLGQNFEVLRPFFISEFINQGLLEVRQGQYWRLITPIFIHFGLMHVVFNLTMTWQLGEVIERRFGALRFSALVILLALVSNLLQFYTSGPGFGGLSGVVYGLFGYFWIGSRFNPNFGASINPSAVKILMLWFVLCWFNFFGLLGEIRIANMAHTGGLITGMLLGFIGSLNARAGKPSYKN